VPSAGDQALNTSHIQTVTICEGVCRDDHHTDSTTWSAPKCRPQTVHEQGWKEEEARPRKFHSSRASASPSAAIARGHQMPTSSAFQCRLTAVTLQGPSGP
jgi:hypothetical protein